MIFFMSGSLGSPNTLDFGDPNNTVKQSMNISY